MRDNNFRAIQKYSDDTITFVTKTKPEEYIIVLIEQQLLLLILKKKVAHTYHISTSRFGVGNMAGSNMTPTGVHRIITKIGDNAPPGRVFRDRVDSGIDWHIGDSTDNLILSRILRLEGLEPGINKGDGIDSFERYIYIHGTNREDKIGTPNSHGCICMKNSEIIEVYSIVKEGTIVFIY